MIKSWVFYLFVEDTLPDVSSVLADATQLTYDRYLKMTADNETQGFEGVFFSEHHFGTINLTPSPHLMIAAASQRTKTLRLGVMGSVLPMHDVRRLAEECGMLDYITHGRLEIGIAPGAGPQEYLLAGFPLEQLRPRYQSGADLLDKYFANAPVTQKDQFYNLENLTIIPGMRQQKPSIWVTALSEESFVWSARRGYKVCTAWLPQPAVNRLAAAYRHAAEEAGQPSGPDQIGVRRRVFVAPTDAEARDIAEAAVDPFLDALRRDLPAFEAADEGVIQFLSQPDDIIVGSPATVAEQLIDQSRQCGAGHILFMTDFRLFGHDKLERSHDLIGREVVPALRRASIN